MGSLLEGASSPLSDLPAHVLALVADSLALVGLRQPDVAHLGGALPDLFLCDALDHDLGLRRHLEGDAGRRVHDDGMRVADVELERSPAKRGAVADALDLEALLEAVRDALDHVRDEGARQPVQRSVVAALGWARDDELPVLLLDLDPRRNHLRQLAERPVDRHAARVDRDVDAVRDLDGLLADSTHSFLTR